MLTGTPALSRPVELFTQIEILDQNFANYVEFTARYCGAYKSKFGWVATGATNLEELKMLLFKTIMIRRIKSEVFMELGAKYRELVTLEEYDISGEKDEEMEEFRRQFNKEGSESSRVNDDALFQWYQRTGEKKAFGVCAFVKDYINKNDVKILVFAHHASLMNALTAELEKVNVNFVRIDGTVRGSVRTERVAEFQNNSQIRVAILSIRACNAGITLTAASTVIFGELDFNPR